MTTRERFERKLTALKNRYEALAEQMLDAIENLEGEVEDMKTENAALIERLDEAEASAGESWTDQQKCFV